MDKEQVELNGHEWLFGKMSGVLVWKTGRGKGFVKKARKELGTERWNVVCRMNSVQMFNKEAGEIRPHNQCDMLDFSLPGLFIVPGDDPNDPKGMWISEKNDLDFALEEIR